MIMDYHVPFGKRSTDKLIAELPAIKDYAKIVLLRLHRVADIPEGARVLDVGASVGRFVVACNELGYSCEGVEPVDLSREKSKEIAEKLKQPI